MLFVFVFPVLEIRTRAWYILRTATGLYSRGHMCLGYVEGIIGKSLELATATVPGVARIACGFVTSLLGVFSILSILLSYKRNKVPIYRKK